MLDAVSSVEDYVDYCAKFKLPACACTDHGYVMGHYDLFRLSEKKGIKPIPGVEAYLYPGDDYQFNQAMAVGKKKAEFAYFHLTLWAASQEGYRNLSVLCNATWNEGRVVTRFGSQKPRVNWHDLQMFGADLICGSGCLFGPVSYAWSRDEIPMMELAKERLMSIFPGRLFVELIPTPVISDYFADAVSCRSRAGRNFQFKSTDMLLTEYGEISALEAANRRVCEINDARPSRRHECDITATPELDRVMTIEGDFDPTPQILF